MKIYVVYKNTVVNHKKIKGLSMVHSSKDDTGYHVARILLIAAGALGMAFNALYGGNTAVPTRTNKATPDIAADIAAAPATPPQKKPPVCVKPPGGLTNP
jgi:hypothetical protein